MLNCKLFFSSLGGVILSDVRRVPVNTATLINRRVSGSRQARTIK